VFGERRDEEIQLGHFQQNIRMIEIGWGNGGNSMLAYSLYHLGEDWAAERATQLVNGMLRLEGTGFQIDSGPLAGAWINGYDADVRRFQYHFGGQQVFLPDQGIVNYFLAKCFLEGHNTDPDIVRHIRRNCEEFLAPLEARFGTFPNALSPDGSTGYSREAYRYDRGVLPGLALAALSFVVLYELTGEKEQLRTAEDILRRHVAPLIDRHEFGFLEYDHNGHDSAGACMTLIAFAEYLELAEANLKELVQEIQKKVFLYLLSFRHEHDFFLYEHSKNVLGWGGIARNRFGFMHGFTPGSTQGTYCLHIRYEYGYALLRTLQTASSPLVRSALINYLNYVTYQQFVNPDLKKGFGGVTEHTALSTYLQDTTHLIHSTPLPFILVEENPALLCDGA
jgi:hypothetical protein